MSPKLLFGGSFDPFHLGHKALIDSVKVHYQENVDIHLLPTAYHSQKQAFRLSTFQRVALLEKVLRSEPLVKLNLIEFQLPKPSYTYHTLEALKGSVDVLLIGRDQLDNFSSWYRYKDILKQVTLLVASRGKDFSKEDQHLMMQQYPEARIEFLNNPLMPMASSAICLEDSSEWDSSLLSFHINQLIDWGFAKR